MASKQLIRFIRKNPTLTAQCLFHFYYLVGYSSWKGLDREKAQFSFEMCVGLFEEFEILRDNPFLMCYRDPEGIPLRIYSIYGDILNGVNDLEAATECYRKSLQYSPNDKALAFKYVDLLYEQALYAKGIAVLEPFRNIIPKDPDILLMLANLYWRDGNVSMAIQYASTCLRYHNSDYRLNCWVEDPGLYQSTRALLEEIPTGKDDINAVLSDN